MSGRVTGRAPWVVVLVILLVITAGAIAVALQSGAADTTATIVREIRAPRIVMALLIGIGLAAAGVLLQGTLRNPLADPALIGISSGAALGCVIGAAVGITLGTVASGITATLGAGVAMAAVVWAATRQGRPEVVTLLLAGIAVAAFSTAAVAIAVSVVPDAGVRSLAFWTTGSLALSTWSAVIAVAPFVVLGLLVAFSVVRSLDVLALGDRDAAAVGIDVRRVRVRALAAVVLLIGAGVAAVGVIAFIGLVIPHAVRIIIGPRTGPVLIVSSVAGALLLLVADTLARVAAAPVEIPVGAITALIGAPVFFVLLWRTRIRQGGWA